MARLRVPTLESSLLIAGLLLPTVTRAQDVEAIFLLDQQNFAIYHVDPSTGDRTAVAGCVDEGCSSQVGSGEGLGVPEDIYPDYLTDPAVLLYCDSAATGKVAAIDPNTLERSTISGCTNGCGSITGTGPSFSDPRGLCKFSNGDIGVADDGVDALFRVDPTTGNRTLVTGGGAGSGDSIGNPIACSDEVNGKIYLISSSNDDVIEVDTATGARDRIFNCSFGPPCTEGTSAIEVSFLDCVAAVDNNGTNEVSVCSNPFFPGPSIQKIDTVSKIATTVTGCVSGGCTGTVGSGTPLDNGELALDSNAILTGRWIFTRQGSGTIIEIDPSTGDRTTISGCDNPPTCTTEIGSGPSIGTPTAISAVLASAVPASGSGARIVLALGAVALGGWRLRRRLGRSKS